MTVCFNLFFNKQIVLLNVLNDTFVASLIGLVPAHLPRSHSLQCVRGGSAKLTFHEVLQVHRYRFISYFLLRL